MADLALSGLVVVAPLAAGSWKLPILPALMLLAIVGWTSLYGRTESRRIHLGLLSASLLALAGYSALQALPLTEGPLRWLSPRAAELRAFVQGDALGGPLSYEPGATWREAAKLVLYALVVQLARERARRHGVRDRIAVPFVVAGLLAAAVAVLHRVLGIDRLFGLIDTLTSPRDMLSTLVNPNHTAGLMDLVTLTAVGLAVDSRDIRRRLAFGLAAAVAAAVSLLSLSKGGVGALVVGLGLFAVLSVWRRRHPAESASAVVPAALTSVTLGGAALVMWRLEDLVRWLESGPAGSALGLAEKAAALQDAFPLVAEHLVAGIGRGAYVSVYTLYKTSPLQLTFAFPENIAVQLISEWGVVVGALALAGLVFAVLSRLWRARRPLHLAMMCGVTAVLLQNFVDFSWELPGLAVPVAAILGGTSADWRGSRKLSRAQPAFWAVVASPPALGLGAVFMAFVAGDLAYDIARLQERVELALAKAPLPESPSVASLVARHPASAMMAAQAAYLMEVRDPPDLPRALALANRTLYLAPTYAGGHMVAGRLLVKAGFRRQGFGELRHAWSLSGGDTLPRYLDHIIELAREPGEVAQAAPRRDVTEDVISEGQLARAAHRMVAMERSGWAKALLEAYVDVDQVPQEDLRAVAVAADVAGAGVLAMAAAERALAAQPHDVDVRLFAARLYFRHGRRDDARRLLDGLSGGGADEIALLELRLRMEVEDHDVPAAAATLKALRARAQPSAAREEELALLEARLYQRAGDTQHALEVLDAALARQPGSIELRVARAQSFIALRRHGAARDDLQQVLKARPRHARARALLERLGREEQ